MGQGKEEQLLKKFSDYASGFYYDCTRYGLSDMIRNICSSTMETKDYSKFSSAVANVLFKKIYVEGEVWNPRLIIGLIDIILELIDIKEVSTGFIPANAMLGEEKSNTDDLRSTIVEQFNKHVREFGEPEMTPL